MPETDLELLMTAARLAGETAARFSGQTTRIWDKPDGAGPVTEADLAVNSVLEQHLRQARPEYGWLSEETEDAKDRLACDRVFIVDPIDGTRSFVEGSRTWAHSIAIAENGKLQAGVVFLPLRDMLFVAASGRGATLNGEPIRVSEVGALEDAEVLATKPTLDPRHWPTGVPDFTFSHRPSLAYRLGLVARGRYDAMLTFRSSWEWDIAAGALIVEEAGGVSSDRTGKPLRFNNPHPALNGVIAGGPQMHKAVLDALRR